MKPVFASKTRPLALLLILSLSGCQVLSSIEREVASGTLDETLPLPAQPERPAADSAPAKTEDPQRKIGAKQHPKVIAANGGVYENPAMEALLAQVLASLTAADAATTRDYQLTLLDTPAVNAFALPGGYIYVTRGLLALADDAAEIAAVLAHEMAHVEADHGIARSRQVASGELVKEVLSEVVTNDVAGAVAQSAATRRQATFSQNQELQADALGIRRLGAAGFDPFAASSFLAALARFSAWQQGDDGGQTDLGSSHPSTPRRIELARRHARAIGPRGEGRDDRTAYLAALEGMAFGERAAEGFVRGTTFAHPGLGIAFDVPAGFELTNRRDGVLASGPDEQALRFDTVDIEDEADPAAYLASGWIAGLDPASVTRTTLADAPAATGRAEAGDWRFAVTVVARKGRFHRFIFATPRLGDANADDGAAAAISGSLRVLGAAEAARFQPLKVEVVTVGRRDTVDRLARRMQGVARPAALFRALNGLGEREEPRRGDRVKIVTG